MKTWSRGIAVAAVQCLIVLSVAGKYAVDRNNLPRVWAKAAAFDPNLPLRGRYISLRLEVETPAATEAGDYSQAARLSIRDGRLFAMPDKSYRPSSGDRIRIGSIGGRPATLLEPVLFFLPEHAVDPSRRPPGEELWVEVSLPPNGPPRPIRLGVKKDGVLTPLSVPRGI